MNEYLKYKRGLEKEGLVCYDGLHRLHALTKGLEVTIDILCDAIDDIVWKYFENIDKRVNTGLTQHDDPIQLIDIAVNTLLW